MACCLSSAEKPQEISHKIEPGLFLQAHQLRFMRPGVNRLKDCTRVPVAVSLHSENTVIAGGFTNTQPSTSPRLNATAALPLPSPVPFSFPGTKMSIFTRALSRGQALIASPDGSDLNVFFAAEARASRRSVPLNSCSVFKMFC